MICGSFSEFQTNQEFDIITLWDIIEHVDDPVGLLKSTLQFIKNGGLLIIETGNYQSADRIVGKKRWWGYQLDHRWYFTPAVIKNILTRLGLEKISVSPKTLRPGWTPDADYICPSIIKVAKKTVKTPLKVASHLRDYVELKRAWRQWPQWVSNGIFTISAHYHR